MISESSMSLSVLRARSLATSLRAGMPSKMKAYAAYYGVSHFAYYLRGKQFILETDHRNLLWIEKSDVPIVVRWRVFLQSFVMFVRHIAGTKMTQRTCTPTFLRKELISFRRSTVTSVAY